VEKAKKFLFDLQTVYKMLEKEQEELQSYFNLVKGYNSLLDPKLQEVETLIEEFLEFVGLIKNEESTLAALQRIVNLREDALLQIIKEFKEEEKIKVREKAYIWVSEFYLSRFLKRLREIEEKKLLTPFYRTLLRYSHYVGEAFSSWQSSWTAQIIYGINRELFELFNGDEDKIFELLNSKNLLDKGHNGEVGDRSYSVLRLEPNGEFKRLSYAQAFKEEVELAAKRVQEMIEALKQEEDEVFNQKQEWLEYLKAIYSALKEEEVDRLIPRWAEVDRKWMKITTPIQIGHPLEYYEDRYRKAVALEWDVRISDPTYPKGNRVKQIEKMFLTLYKELNYPVPSIYEQTLQNLKKVQLYISRPFSFYGSEFNGLFSAQVVPNDEMVSKELGKKIFAYPDLILQMQRAKPKMKITYEVFGEKISSRFYKLLEKRESWHKIYDITTIGHEYGHILWIDSESEAKMNLSGMFKLVEEFKATAGGLVTHFLLNPTQLWEELLLDHIQRSVSLISWMEVEEVLPYYVEGLLHLEGLFTAGVLEFKERLECNLTLESYKKLREWYLSIYKELALYYLQKRDPKQFLEKLIVKEDNRYLPSDERLKEFVRYYYGLYTKIGREVLKE